jgi:hypothetical protein
VLPIELLSTDAGGCYLANLGPLTFELHPGALRWEGEAPADVWLPCTDGGRVVHLAPGDVFETAGCLEAPLRDWTVACTRTGGVARCDLAAIEVEAGLPWIRLTCGETEVPLAAGTTWVDPGGDNCELVATDATGALLGLDRAAPGEQWTCRPMEAGGGCMLREPR